MTGVNAKKSLDWEAIERDYRLGQLSLRALAEKHGCTAAGISKKAKEKGWARDATAEVRERTRSALLVDPRKGKDREVNTGVNSVNTFVNTPTREDIEVAVQTNVEVINRHRSDIARGQGLVALLFSQLHDAAEDREGFIGEIHAETMGDKTSVRRTSMKKAVSLPVHAGVLRDLSTVLKNLIPLERQAYNLDEQQHEESYEDRLKRLIGE